jgi:hypothetical protein
MLHAYPSKAVLPEIHPVASLNDLRLLEVWAAWTMIKGDTVRPGAPGDILRHVPRHIKDLHLSEVVEDGKDFRFRIIGESVFPGLSENQTGQLVSAHPDPGVRLRFGILMKAVLDAGAPIRGISKRLTEHARHDYRIESVWLPFGTTSVNYIVGMSRFEPLEPA